MQKKITPFLWFNDQAEEAMNFYCSIFKSAQPGKVSRWSGGGPGEKGKVMSATFTLEGQEFFALNGGPHYTFTPAISFFVDCRTQAEVDDLWDKLSDGGKIQQCGWLQDKYGLSWQIVPSILTELLQDKDSQKSARVMQAMMKMIKLDIAGLEAAARG